MAKYKGITFGVNKNNQLLVKVQPHKKSKLLRGEFKTDDTNRLVYFINEPDNWQRKYNIPNKIVFEGKWRLNSNHDLILDLEKDEKGRRKSLKLKGTILDVGEDLLIFQIKSRLQEEITTISHLKLTGIWHSDKFNRIIFAVAKEEKPDVLILRNIWHVNKSNQIIYNYEKLETKTNFNF